MAPASKPVYVIVPGAAQNPSHYAYLSHLLQSQGYGCLSALLPTVGTSAPITVDDDTKYVRERMLLPVLDLEEHDVILVSHSYSGIPASAAAKGLSRVERAREGKATAVLGLVFIAAVLARGGDGKDLVATFGGQLPPHIRVDEEQNLILCDDPKPPLYHDVSPDLANAAVLSTLSPSLTSFRSPCPAATWDAEPFRGRCAYIRTLNDRTIPYEVQNMMLQGTGQEWITRDVETGHNPQLAAPEKLCGILLELSRGFEELGEV